MHTKKGDEKMDTILATMILMTPLTSIWAFILSETRTIKQFSKEGIQLGTEYLTRQASPDCMQTPDQEAVSALNRIWDSLLRPTHPTP
jgi:hypothetical protein